MRRPSDDRRRAHTGPGAVALAATLCLGPLVGTGAARAAGPGGAEVFAGHCAVCHGPAGAGVPSTFPPLGAQIRGFAQTPAGREYLITAVTAGLIGSVTVAGGTYMGAMPAQGLNEADLAAVLNYVASGLQMGKALAKPFDADEVGAIRARHTGVSGVAALALRPALPDK